MLIRINRYIYCKIGFDWFVDSPEIYSSSDRARNPPGQPTAEIQWADFYQNLLLKGEVQEIIIHAGVNRWECV